MKQLLKHFIRSTTTKLATTYLIIIMLMSLGFSIVFYNTSSNALSSQVPPNDAIFHYNTSQTTTPSSGQTANPAGTQTTNANPKPKTEIRDFLRERAAGGRHKLLMRLIVLNLTALIAGGIVSYFLARRTLRPIELAMEAQAQFVSDASHELRTPLTSIQTSNDVALRNKNLTLSGAKQVIRESTEESIKLKLLSDGLLDLAKNGNRPHKLQPVAVQAAVTEAINHVMTLAQESSISIEDATADIRVMGDSHALSQLLIIFLDNAIKYSGAKTTIHITTSVKGSFTYLHIADEGIGIRASDLPHIFRRFYRADTTRSEGHRHGYGLGLAIAQNLASAHDAHVSARSELGKGSVFTIRMRSAKSA